MASCEHMGSIPCFLGLGIKGAGMLSAKPRSVSDETEITHSWGITAKEEFFKVN